MARAAGLMTKQQGDNCSLRINAVANKGTRAKIGSIQVAAEKIVAGTGKCVLKIGVGQIKNGSATVLWLQITAMSVLTLLEMGMDSHIEDELLMVVSKSPWKGSSLWLASANSKLVVGRSKNKSATVLGLTMTATLVLTLLEMDRLELDSHLRNKLLSMVGLMSIVPGLTSSSSLTLSMLLWKGSLLELASMHSKSVVGRSKKQVCNGARANNDSCISIDVAGNRWAVVGLSPGR
jgi:hypothetical protein